MTQLTKIVCISLLLCSGWSHAQKPNPFQALRAIEERATHGVQQGLTGIERGIQHGVTGAVKGIENDASGVARGVAGAAKGVQNDVNTVLRATAPEFAQIAACLERSILDGKPVGLPPPAALANHPKDFITAVVREVSSVLHSEFPQIMQQQLLWLRQGFNSVPAHGEIVRESIESWKRFARMHPRASCMVPIVEKFQPELESAAIELKSELEADFRSLYHQHVEPVLHDAVGKGLSTLITSKNDDGLLLTKQELADVVSGVYARYLIQQLQSSANVVAAFQGSLGKSAPPHDQLSLLQKTLSPDAQWPELFRQELGIEIVRAMGHKFIDSNKPPHGGFLINQAVGLFQLSEGTIEKIGEGICGLIPEAGAAICAVAEVALDALWNQGLVPTMRWGIKQGLHELLDKEISNARSALAANKTLENFRASNSPLNGIATLLSKDLINSIADQHLKDIRIALNGFNASVNGLAVTADQLSRPR